MPASWNTLPRPTSRNTSAYSAPNVASRARQNRRRAQTRKAVGTLTGADSLGSQSTLTRFTSPGTRTSPSPQGFTKTDTEPRLSAPLKTLVSQAKLRLWTTGQESISGSESTFTEKMCEIQEASADRRMNPFPLMNRALPRLSAVQKFLRL